MKTKLPSMRATFSLLVLAELVAVLSLLTSCNLMEAVHQTSPNYTNAVPFSDKWYSDREAAKAKRKWEQEQLQRTKGVKFH